MDRGAHRHRSRIAHARIVVDDPHITIVTGEPCQPSLAPLIISVDGQDNRRAKREDFSQQRDLKAERCPSATNQGFGCSRCVEKRCLLTGGAGEFAPSPGLHGRFVYETAQPRVLRMPDEATRTSSYSSMPSGPASSERVSEDMPSRNHTPHPPFPSTPPRRHGLHSTPQDNTHL